MKKPLKIFVIVVASFFVLNGLKNAFTGFVVSTAVSRAAHVPASVGSVSLQFTRARLTLKNVKLFNPRGYPEKLLLDLPEVDVQFDPASIFTGRPHFKKIKVNMKELIVIKNRDGQVNVNALKPAKTQVVESKKDRTPQKTAGIRIDELTLSIGQVVYKDYSVGRTPSTQVFDLHVQERTFRNVESLSGVVSILMFETLTRTTLNRLVNLDMALFKEGAGSALTKGLGLAGNGADTVQDAAKSILDLFN